MARDLGRRDPTPWADRANCIGVNPALFFPDKGGDGTAKEAKAVCAGCVVRDACLEYALVNCEKFGVWGGKSEKERRHLRRTRRRSAA